MKYLIIFRLTIFAALLIISSCNENTTNTKNDIETISATINGNSWVSTDNYINQELGTSSKILRIQGEKNEEKIELALQFSPFDTLITGSYSLTPNGDYFAIYKHNNIADTAISGNVNILEYNYNEETGKLRAKGNFNFIVNTLDGNYNIKDGYFFTPGN